MTKKTKILFWVLLILWIGGFLLSFTFASLPYEQARTWADRFARDGSMDFFTPDRFKALVFPLQSFAAFNLIVGGVAATFYRRTLKGLDACLHWLGCEWQHLRKDTRTFRQDLTGWSIWKQDGWILIAVTLLGLVNRLVLIMKPMGADESYTYFAFAARPFFKVISDYHLPNNHIFHTILVFLSTRLLGNAPWEVRLPAFVMGVLTVPLVYLLARKWYRRPSAIASALAVSALPMLIQSSTDARGYSLLGLFTLLAFLAATHARQKKNRVAWLLVSLLGALGLYTVPVMFIPLGILYTWLGLSLIADDYASEYQNRSGFLKYIFVAGIGTLGLTAIFYSPVLLFSGPQALFGNTFVQRLSWSDFSQTAPLRMMDTWQNWTAGWEWTGWLYAAGLVLSLVFHRKIATHKVPVLLAALLWIPLQMLVQRPNPWSKIWTSILALVVIWGSAGLLGLEKLLPEKGKLRKAFIAGMLTLFVGVTLVRSAQNIRANAPYLDGAQGELEQVALYLVDEIKPGEIIVNAGEDGSATWYYLYYYQVSDELFARVQQAEFDAAYVLVNPSKSQSLESVILERPMQLERFDLTRAALVHSIGNTEIYRVPAADQ